MQPVVLGVDFGGTKIAAAVTDLDGHRLGEATIRTAPGDSAELTFHRGIDAARTLLARVAADAELVAVGACTFGIPHDDRIDLAPTIDGWSALPFGRELRLAFPGVPIHTATDVKAAAQAEAEWGALRACDPAIYLNLGTGLAAAIVVGGSVLDGHNGAAGEIGYNLRGREDLGTGDQPMLEDYVSGKALDGTARRILSETDDAAVLFDAAHDDARAAGAVGEFVTELAFHLVNLTIAVNPARIAVGGGMVRSWEQLRGRLHAALQAAVPFPPELVRAAFPYDAPLLGALALARQAARVTQPPLESSSSIDTAGSTHSSESAFTSELSRPHLTKGSSR
jgi:glucokinase